MLARAACLAPGEPIPRHLLRRTLQLADDDLGTRERVADAMFRLVELGLMHAEANGTFRVHRLIVSFVQNASSTMRVGAQEAVETVLLAETERINEIRIPSPLRELHGHLRMVTTIARSRNDELSARLNHAMGEHLWQIGDYRESLSCLEYTVAVRKKILGELHHETARSLTDLGLQYASQGEWVKAEALYQQALAIQRQLFAEGTLDTAYTLNNLGIATHMRRAFQEAECFHEEALQIRRRIQGNDSTLVAESISNLAYLCFVQSDLVNARSYLEQALAIRESALGEEHPDTARTLNNLGEVYLTQQDYDAAENVFQRGLTIRRKVLGTEHPDLAHSLCSLGALYKEKGQRVAAKNQYQSALSIRQKALGNEHPDTLAVSDLIQELESETDT